MAYLPKSKIKIKTAIKDELVFLNGNPFQGQYIATNSGRFYAGTNHLILGKELKPAPKPPTYGGYGNLDKSIDVHIHNILLPPVNNFVSSTRTISTSKPQPTEKDYTKGYYQRYFVKRINDFNYKEINKDTYNSILTRDGKYDHYLNEVGKLNWHLKGNVHKKNNTSITLTNRTFLNIKHLFPKLNEYHRIDSVPTPQNNLHTTGKELYYSDGKEYIGPYHIHPEKGPMVGAEHSSISHHKLYYPNQLLKTGNSKYQDFIEGLDKTGDNLLIIDKRPVKTEKAAAVEVKQQTTSTPSYGGGSSGGGGGGY